MLRIILPSNKMVHTFLSSVFEIDIKEDPRHLDYLKEF